PKAMDFWWPDSPAHALNGALIHDFVAAHAFTSPFQFAVNYYLRYPALTISFYPPLFPGAEAVVSAVLGGTHFAAQLTVNLFTALLAVYLFRLARFCLPSLGAAGTVLLALGTPAIALWSRQVMLEIPAYSLLVASAYYLVRYLRAETPRDLYSAIGFFCAAVYTKQTT